MLIDFGEARFASVTTGFTMQQYRSPAIELYGSDGVLQLLGDDWAPDGYELWRNARGAWELFPESDPGWQWTEGLRHLVDCIESGREPVTRPEHAYHALEIMLAAQAAAADGRAREIASDFPRPDLAALEQHAGRAPRPRPALGIDLGEVGMARISMAYIGGGSTRGAGTMASFIHQGENFDGSEVVLIDLDPERLDLIRRLAERMARARGLDLKIEATTDRRAGLSRLRRDSLELSPRRLRGARPRREDPAQARHHRPGDAGAGRLLHGAARDPRDAGDPRRRRGRLPRARASSTTRTRSTCSRRR